MIAAYCSDCKSVSPAGAWSKAASCVFKADTAMPTLTDIGFVLVGGRLLTIGDAEPKSFGLFIAALHRLLSQIHLGAAVLAKLLESFVDRTAKIIEQAVAPIDILSTHTFGERVKKVRRRSNYLEQKLRYRPVSQICDRHMSLSRLLAFAKALPSVQQGREAKEPCRNVARDVQSLSEHAAFVAGNVTFLLDALPGLINIEQNAIIMIFAIASVVFLPPTLVASVYGMNLEHMPELHATPRLSVILGVHGGFRRRPVFLFSLERLALRA